MTRSADTPTQVGDTKRSEDIERKYTASPTEGAAAKFDRQYRRRLEYRCQGLLTKAGERCRRTFEKAYASCYDKVTFLAAWLLCWPMKLSFICNMVSVRREAYYTSMKRCCRFYCTHPSRLNVSVLDDGWRVVL